MSATSASIACAGHMPPLPWVVVRSPAGEQIYVSARHADAAEQPSLEGACASPNAAGDESEPRLPKAIVGQRSKCGAGIDEQVANSSVSIVWVGGNRRVGEQEVGSWDACPLLCFTDWYRGYLQSNQSVTELPYMPVYMFTEHSEFQHVLLQNSKKPFVKVQCCWIN